jgi:GNAT superfamily N-acetyltransferase
MSRDRATADGSAGSDIELVDGTVLRVREIRPDHDEALRAFHARLSPESIVLRFFGPHPRLSDAEVRRFTQVDGIDRMALVTEHAAEIVAVARYDRAPGSDRAEVAFVVDDAYQGRGIGTILLQHLAAAARSVGIRWLEADTLSENFRMLHVFRDAGFPRTFTRASEVMRVVMDIGAPSQNRPGTGPAAPETVDGHGTPPPGPLEPSERTFGTAR